MPLSGIGLCEAEMTTPRSAPSDWVRKATPGVGSTRRRSTSTPAEASPATTACSMNCPEIRVSRPTTASGPVTGELAPGGQHPCGGNGKVQGQLSGQMTVGQAPDPVRAEYLLCDMFCAVFCDMR